MRRWKTFSSTCKCRQDDLTRISHQYAWRKTETYVSSNCDVPNPEFIAITQCAGRNPSGGYRRANRLSCRFVSLVFLMRSVPGAPPTGTLRVSKSVPDGFVPPAGTCSLRPSPCLQPAEPAPLLTTAGAGSAKAGGQALGATLRAAVAVQIVCPDNLSLNHSHRYAFGPRIKYGAGSGTRWQHKSARSRFGRPQDACRGCAMDGVHLKSSAIIASIGEICGLNPSAPPHI